MYNTIGQFISQTGNLFMAIEGFDYKSFAASMAEQAKELVPADLDDPRPARYRVDTLYLITKKTYLTVGLF